MSLLLTMYTSLSFIQAAIKIRHDDSRFCPSTLHPPPIPTCCKESRGKCTLCPYNPVVLRRDELRSTATSGDLAALCPSCKGVRVRSFLVRRQSILEVDALNGSRLDMFWRLLVLRASSSFSGLYIEADSFPANA